MVIEKPTNRHSDDADQSVPRTSTDVADTEVDREFTAAAGSSGDGVLVPEGLTLDNFLASGSLDKGPMDAAKAHELHLAIMRKVAALKLPTGERK